MFSNYNKDALFKQLTQSLERGHIWPAFQPIVDIRSGNVVSFEILARWDHPNNGGLSPEMFIPCLERHDLIDVLFNALIERACSEAMTWPGKFTLAFNISPNQLISDTFTAQLMQKITMTGFPPDRIELEVTEGSLITDEDRTYATLMQLNKLGMKVGIDDFGTGYSNLARLEAYPFHKLKIDRRFVCNLDAMPGKRRIAAAIIGLGQSLGITVVAEGVETAAEEAVLRELGCDLGQGWYYGKGEPAGIAQRCLQQRGSSAVQNLPVDTSPFQQLHQLGILYAQSPIGLCFLDMNFRYVRANDQFASMYGVTGEELQGKSVFDVMSGERLETIIEILSQCELTPEPIAQRKITGDRDIQVIAARVLDICGTMIGYSVLSIDFTEESRLKMQLVEAEQKIREELDYVEAIIDSLPGTFYFYRNGRNLTKWNKNLEIQTGYSEDELVNGHALDLFPEDQRHAVAAAIERVFLEEKAEIDADIVFKNGERKPYRFTAAKFEYNGEIGFIGTSIDISELWDLKRALSER